MRVLSPNVYARLNKEGEKVEEPKIEGKESLVCPECKFVSKSAFGLRAHMKKHEKGE